MILKRKIEQSLARWADTEYALLLLGARQVGKSFLVNRFVHERFASNEVLSLHNNVSLIKAILSAKDQQDFVLRLSAFCANPVVKGGCLVIDEMQEFYVYLSKHPEIEAYFDLITAMKDITKVTGIRFVLTGSLLRLSLDKLVHLYPEGSLLRLEMFPLDFEEFLWARGLNPDLIEQAKSCLAKGDGIPEYLHEKLLSEYRLYLLVGGMPHAVSEFIDRNSFVYVSMAHQTIDDFIRQDIAKYAPDDAKVKIESIYELLPRELDSPTKRFTLSSIVGHKKSEQEYMNFGWLSQAGVAIIANAVSQPVAPLKASSSLNKAKLFHEDVGMLTYLLMDAEMKQRALAGEDTFNYGAIYENAVAQSLHAHGFTDLFFYSNKERGEVDFLVERHGQVELIEVKSGKDYKRHSALTNLLATTNYRFGRAMVFCNENVSQKNGIDYLPIYAADFLIKQR